MFLKRLIRRFMSFIRINLLVLPLNFIFHDFVVFNDIKVFLSARARRKNVRTRAGSMIYGEVVIRNEFKYCLLYI